jgi:hypothetical protein
LKEERFRRHGAHAAGPNEPRDSRQHMHREGRPNHAPGGSWQHRVILKNGPEFRISPCTRPFLRALEVGFGSQSAHRTTGSICCTLEAAGSRLFSGL